MHEGRQDGIYITYGLEVSCNTAFNSKASAKAASTRLQWPVPVKGTSISNTGEVALAPVKEAVELAPLEVVTLRVER